jgi:hypothetical protein
MLGQDAVKIGTISINTASYPGDCYFGQGRYENLKLLGEGSADAKPITQSGNEHSSSFPPRPDRLQSLPSLLSVIHPGFFARCVERPEFESHNIPLVPRHTTFIDIPYPLHAFNKGRLTNFNLSPHTQACIFYIIPYEICS